MIWLRLYSSQMVDRLALLDGYGAFASCCRDGIVRLWDATSLLPAQPAVVVPPAESLRPTLNIRDPREEDLRGQQEGLRRLREHLTEEERRNAQINTGQFFGDLNRALLPKVTSAQRAWRLLTKKYRSKHSIDTLWREVQKETEAAAVLAEQVRQSRADTEALAQKLPMAATTPGLLSRYTRPGPRARAGPWALDAATLQVPSQWIAGGFRRGAKPSDKTEKQTETRKFGATWRHETLPAWLKEGTNFEQRGSQIEMAPPPRPWPVVFLCADSTIRMWHRNGENPNGTWCERTPDFEGQMMSLKSCEHTRVLAAPTGCVPVCLARALPGAVSNTSWSDVSNDWVQAPRVVVGSADGTIRAWEVGWDGKFWNLAPQSHYSTRFHSDQVLCCLRATPYYMISGGLDAAVVLSDQHRWEAIWTGEAHTAAVVSVDFALTSR